MPLVGSVRVPYAFEAHEAETLGGRSVSDFALAKDGSSTNSAANATSTYTVPHKRRQKRSRAGRHLIRPPLRGHQLQRHNSRPDCEGSAKRDRQRPRGRDLGCGQHECSGGHHTRQPEQIKEMQDRLSRLEAIVEQETTHPSAEFRIIGLNKKYGGGRPSKAAAR